jgi:hypothetical protein
VPRFDGTGPQGQGPMTGRGEGYCAIKIPESGEAPYGYAGQQGTPVVLGAPGARPPLGTRFARGLRAATWLGRAFGMRRGRGAGRRRGRRQRWW